MNRGYRAVAVFTVALAIVLALNTPALDVPAIVHVLIGSGAAVIAWAMWYFTGNE